MHMTGREERAGKELCSHKEGIRHGRIQPGARAGLNPPVHLGQGKCQIFRFKQQLITDPGAPERTQTRPRGCRAPARPVLPGGRRRAPGRAPEPDRGGGEGSPSPTLERARAGGRRRQPGRSQGSGWLCRGSDGCVKARMAVPRPGTPARSPPPAGPPQPPPPRTSARPARSPGCTITAYRGEGPPAPHLTEGGGGGGTGGTGRAWQG